MFDQVAGGRCSRLAHAPGLVESHDRDVTPAGVRALGGNVSEWVTTSTGFIAKGGSWAGLAIDLHPAKVLEIDPSVASFATLGFRCASSVAASQ